MIDSKSIYLIAGPNGAGKTTASMKILPTLLDCEEFVNADEIAKGLAPFHPEKAALEAGKLQVQHINQLIHEGKSFAIETTLSPLTYLKLIQKVRPLGYTFHLIFICLENAGIAIQRVANRVKEGGHDIPQDTILRRYERGLKNFFHSYKDVVDSWMLYDNSFSPVRLVAQKSLAGDEIIYDNDLYNKYLSYAIH